MKTIAIRDVTGIMEPLPGFSVVRTDGSDGQRSIKLNGYKTTTNQYGYQFVKNENTVVYDDEEYIIKTHRERTYRKGIGVEATAIHRIFDDLRNNYIYDEKTGTLRLDAMLSFALEEADTHSKLIRRIYHRQSELKILDGITLSLFSETFSKSSVQSSTTKVRKSMSLKNSAFEETNLFCVIGST